MPDVGTEESAARVSLTQRVGGGMVVPPLNLSFIVPDSAPAAVDAEAQQITTDSTRGGDSLTLPITTDSRRDEDPLAQEFGGQGRGYIEKMVQSFSARDEQLIIALQQRIAAIEKEITRFETTPWYVCSAQTSYAPPIAITELDSNIAKQVKLAYRIDITPAEYSDRDYEHAIKVTKWLLEDIKTVAGQTITDIATQWGREAITAVADKAGFLAEIKTSYAIPSDATTLPANIRASSDPLTRIYDTCHDMDIVRAVATAYVAGAQAASTEIAPADDVATVIVNHPAIAGAMGSTPAPSAPDDYTPTVNRAWRSSPMPVAATTTADDPPPAPTRTALLGARAARAGTVPRAVASAVAASGGVVDATSPPAGHSRVNPLASHRVRGRKLLSPAPVISTSHVRSAKLMRTASPVSADPTEDVLPTRSSANPKKRTAPSILQPSEDDWWPKKTASAARSGSIASQRSFSSFFTGAIGLGLIGAGIATFLTPLVFIGAAFFIAALFVGFINSKGSQSAKRNMSTRAVVSKGDLEAGRGQALVPPAVSNGAWQQRTTSSRSTKGVGR